MENYTSEASSADPVAAAEFKPSF